MLQEECHVSFDEKSYTLFKAEKELSDQDLLNLLNNSSLYPQIYWKHKSDSIEYGGLGSLLQFDHLPTVSCSLNTSFTPHLFGGLPFSKTYQGDLSTPHFTLPQYLVSRKDGLLTLQAFALNHPPSFEIFESSLHKLQREEFPLLTSKKHLPDFALWKKQVFQTLKKIESSELEKLVLARRTDLQFDKALNPLDLLARLKEVQKNSSFFCFRSSPSSAFLGATPECLFSRKGRWMTTEAIAGTTFLKAKEKELHTAKNLSEFHFVQNYLEARLKNLGQEIEHTGVERISTGTVEHLYSQFKAQLNDTVTDLDLVESLHPTPAVCGTPQDLAERLISQTEPFERGGYAAPMGHITPHTSEFLVGIRSCLVKENTLSLFAGCGLVKDSDPEQEWQELEAKIKGYTQLFDTYAYL